MKTEECPSVVPTDILCHGHYCNCIISEPGFLKSRQPTSASTVSPSKIQNSAQNWLGITAYNPLRFNREGSWYWKILNCLFRQCRLYYRIPPFSSSPIYDFVETSWTISHTYKNKVINEFEIWSHFQIFLNKSGFVSLGYCSTLISGRGGTLLCEIFFHRCLE